MPHNDALSAAVPGRHATEPINPAPGFDPYQAWLNVQEVHRPLTAYELLRILPLEDDSSQIRAAAGVQRMALEVHRGEGSDEVWEQVRDELEEAISILTDEDRKAAYDATLQRAAEGNGSRQAPPPPTGGKGASTIVCGQCGMASSATRRYCANCGESLWEPCLECGTLNFAGGKYCGACGAHVQGAVQQEVDRAKAAVREAETLRKASQYDQAIAVLGPISRFKHARLSQLAEQAGNLIRRLADQRDRSKAEAEEVFASARQCAEQFDYLAAVSWLEQVPPPLRTADMEQFLDSNRLRLREIAAIEAEIRTAMTGGNHHGVPEKVRQLLALKPDHGLAQKLGSQIRDRCIRAARQKFKEHQYAAVLKLLEQVPDQASTPDVVELQQRATDLAFILGDLRNAPYVDKPLLSFVTRLCKMAPGDARGPKLQEELRRRLAASAGSSQRGLVPWAKVPERTHVGSPIDWLTDVAPLEVREQAAETIYRDHPGCLFVACGLALQALGKGPVQTNLLPTDGRGIVGLVGQVLRKRPTNAAWGLDLSASGLKAVRIAAERDQKAMAITDCEVLEHTKPLSQAVNEEERRMLVAGTLKEFCALHPVKAERVCVGLSGRMVLLREIVVPLADRRKMARAVEYEARRQVPFPLADLVWGYETLDQPDARSGANSEVHVAIVAAKHLPLKDHLLPFASAGITVDVVQNDCLALHNFLSFRRGERKQDEDHPDADRALPVALIDLGTDATSVLVSAPGMVWFRSTGFGSQSFNKALVRELKLTAAQAEEYKRDPSKAESPSMFYKAIEPVLEDFVAEIHTSLEAFGRARGHRHIQEILGIGGGFRMHGLLRFLRSGR